MIKSIYKQLLAMRCNCRTMVDLFFDIFKFNPARLMFAFLLMFFKNLSSGVGLLLIIPLMQAIGFSVGGKVSDSITKALMVLFHQLHLALTLPSILISYVALVSLIALAGFAEQCTSTKLQQNYIHHLRARFYLQLLQTKWDFFLKQTSIDLLQSLTSEIQKIGLCHYQLLTLLNNGILILIYTLFALLLSWQMTLIAVFCGLLLLGLLLPLHQKTSQSGLDNLQQNRRMLQSIADHLSAFKMIKGSGYEQTFIDATLKISNRLEQQNQALTTYTAAAKLLYTCSSVVLFSLLLYFSITLLQVPIASLVLLLVIFSRLLPKISAVQQGYQRLLHQLPAFCTLKQLAADCMANQEHLLQEQTQAFAFNEAIVLKNISFSYNPNYSTAIIRNISLQIKKNSITAIIGPSGVGKTTLADLIVGLLDPTEGQILIDQQALSSANKLSWRNSIAYITQNVFLFNASIRYNLQLFCGEKNDAELWEALKIAAAAEFVAALEEGLDTVIGDMGIRLSGGERQRIALARALLSKPQLLILDETTSSLDKYTIANIQQSMKKLHGSMTILIITHQTEMSDIADQRFYLSPITRGIEVCLMNP